MIYMFLRQRLGPSPPFKPPAPPCGLVEGNTVVFRDLELKQKHGSSSFLEPLYFTRDRAKPWFARKILLARVESTALFGQLPLLPLWGGGGHQSRVSRARARNLTALVTRSRLHSLGVVEGTKAVSRAEI